MSIAAGAPARAIGADRSHGGRDAAVGAPTLGYSPGSIAGSPCDGPTAGAILSEPFGAGTPAGHPGTPTIRDPGTQHSRRRGHLEDRSRAPGSSLRTLGQRYPSTAHIYTGHIERMDAKQVWRAALGELQVSLSPANFETWLRDTQLVDVDDQRFRISVPNGFAKDWLETRYRSLISQTLARIVGYSVQVEFVVAASPEGAAPPADGAGATRSSAGGGRLVVPAGPARADPRRRRGRHDLTSTRATRSRNFIVGSANRLAHAASLSVAERPGHAYNPLFLYGGVGLGKTHLMHAIGNQVIAKFPRKRVVYATSEKFTNEFITSIQQGKIDDFRARYRRIDLLLIDDIQFIADKERTQEEFFHTFNAIHEDGKQIVLSSDRPPKAILTLEERLRSRFEWGLIADLTAPDLETRIAILRAKAEEGSLPDHVRRDRVHRAQGREQHPRARGRAQPDRRVREHGRDPDQHRAGPGGPLERPLQPEEAPGDAGADRPRRLRLLQRPDGGPPGPEARQVDRHAPPDRDVPDARGDRRLAPAHRRRAGRPGPLHGPPRLRQDHPRESAVNDDLRREIAAVRELIYAD